jgi:hypothetical protein
MIERFVDAYKSAFRKLPSTALWSNDGVIRTSTMQSYVYPAIANALNFYLVCELPSDVAFYERSAIDKAARLRLAYPSPRDAVICLEHENRYANSRREMETLSRTGASLNVLVTYLHASPEAQILSANETYAPIIKEMSGDGSEFLIVLPSAAQDELNRLGLETGWQQLELWHFFTWDKAAKSFCQLC